MIAGALWVGLMLAATGEVPPAPAPAAASAPAASPVPDAPPAAPAVAVAMPPAGDAVLAEASTRIRAELAASGIASTQVECLPGGAAARAGCPVAPASATIALTREDGVAVIDVLLTPPGGPALRRRIPVFPRDGGDEPSVLAVRAVELLRDLRPAARRPAPVGPAHDDEEPKPFRPEVPPPPPPSRWRFATGAAALASLQRPSVGPAFGVALSAGVLLRPPISVFLTVAGPFTTGISSPDPNSPGSATVSEGLATLELRYRFERGAVQPFGALLTGINYVREAAAQNTMNTATSSTLVAAFGGAGGISFEYHDSFTATVEAQAFVTSPAVSAYVNGVLSAKVGIPSILVLANAGVALP